MEAFTEPAKRLIGFLQLQEAEETCVVWLENHTAVLINIQVSLCWQGLLETPASANYSYKPTLQLSLI